MPKDAKGHGSNAYEMPSGKGVPSLHSSSQGKAKIRIRDTMQVSPEVAAAARARRGGSFGT